MDHPWINDTIFYHIYPLGLCNAPRRNDFQSAPVVRLELLYPWLDHMQELGANALYLGPLFESSAHGYDTADYFQVDRRLGDRHTLAEFSGELHRRGMRLVLDGVFNHVGRNFWAFRDLQTKRQQSQFKDWFEKIDFNQTSQHNDPFSYAGWNGHFDLVKLNLNHTDVRNHLFEAIRVWVDEFEIDGLRLDAADVIASDFLEALSTHCRNLRQDFWLMGEIVQGDYRRLANPRMLDSATNYECYKGLYSSHVDCNYFEIAYSLNRLFGAKGIYRDLTLYSFCDNHDVNRVASNLKNPAHLYPLYTLLFTMPGVPSIYYGSEWGVSGSRTANSDEALRPYIDLAQTSSLPHHDLAFYIKKLADIRRQNPALRRGDYQELHVAHEQFAFLRKHYDGTNVVAVNAAASPAAVNLRLPMAEGRLVDQIDPRRTFQIIDHQVHIDSIPATGALILAIQ